MVVITQPWSLKSSATRQERVAGGGQSLGLSLDQVDRLSMTITVGTRRWSRVSPGRSGFDQASCELQAGGQTGARTAGVSASPVDSCWWICFCLRDNLNEVSRLSLLACRGTVIRGTRTTLMRSGFSKSMCSAWHADSNSQSVALCSKWLLRWSSDECLTRLRCWAHPCRRSASVSHDFTSRYCGVFQIESRAQMVMLPGCGHAAFTSSD